MTAVRLRDVVGGETAAPPANATEILRRAWALAPVLRERADEIERARRLPPDVVSALRATTGVFRMGFARDWGGPDVGSVEQTEVIEALSYGDPAAGWCAMIGSDTGLYAAFLDRDAARLMFPSLDMATAGLLFPSGRADAVPGGWRLTGRWQFGSGATHADWVISGAFRYRDGTPEPGPEPANALLPGDTTEVGGIAVVGELFRGLIEYDAATAAPRNAVAESITNIDSKVWTIKIKPNWLFHDGPGGAPPSRARGGGMTLSKPDEPARPPLGLRTGKGAHLTFQRLQR